MNRDADATPEANRADGVAVCVGPYIVDILARPVTEIPPGQGGARVDEIRLTVAGTAGGTAVDLAQLGVETRALGLRGDDELGEFMEVLLERCGVDVSGLRSVTGVQTAATVLPIRPNGERPALHCPGAYPGFSFDAEAERHLQGARFVHLGGPERFVDSQALAAVARAAKQQGSTVTLDVLASDPSGGREAIDAVVPFVDIFCPNDDQLLALHASGEQGTEEQRLRVAAEGARRAGALAVVVTCGAEGARILDDDGWRREPAFAADVVDTTGCGDAVCAGIIDGLAQGRDLDGAVRRGLAAAALVCERLGSDADLSIERVDEVEANRSRLV